MVQGVMVSAAVFASVNFPLFWGGSTKRLSFLLMASGFLLSLLSGRASLHKEVFPALFFWCVLVLSSLVGGISNQVFNSFFISIFFTGALFFMFLCAIDFREDCVRFLAPSVLCLNVIGAVYILSVIDFDVTRIFFLRRYLLESEVSINSIFNQFYCLLFYNMLLVVTKVRYRYLFACSALVVLFLTLFSLSRQNFMAMILMLLIFLLLSPKTRFWLLLLGVLFFFLVVPFLIELEQLSYVVGRIEKTQSQVSSGEYSRFQQYYDSVIVGLERPFLGLGIGGFYEFAAAKGYPEHTRVPEAAINQLSAEHGVVMLLLFLSIFFWLTVNFWYKAKGHDIARNLSVAFMFGFLFLCLFNEVHVTPMFWMSYFITYMVVCFERKRNGIHS